MKTNYFIFLVVASLLLSCSNSENREKKDKILYDKIVNLKCEQTIEVLEINYTYLVKRLRGHNEIIEFASVFYRVARPKEDFYILTDENKEHLVIILDQIQKVSYGGIRKVPIMKITKICKN